jgi:isopentenyl diphosphate isomerase/L-lactate dehydrogenase-like FMN-dependent dehydrogenase
MRVQGVLHPEDAARAVEVGAAGVVVSNHGGRQLDSAPAPVDVLPAIVSAVGGRVPILLDGGIRRGTDVLKAVALGASAVCVGRPVLYALSRGSEAGVAQALRMLRAEVRLAMALAGCARLADATPDLVHHVSEFPLRSAL